MEYFFLCVLGLKENEATFLMSLPSMLPNLTHVFRFGIEIVTNWVQIWRVWEGCYMETSSLAHLKCPPPEFFLGKAFFPVSNIKTYII